MTHHAEPGKTSEAQVSQTQASAKRVWFDRRELDQILWVYGKLVAEGECRDYAIGAFADHALFSMHKRSSDAPTWTIEKWPALARLQGAYVLGNATGQTLKRGHELSQVLRFFDKKRFQVID